MEWFSQHVVSTQGWVVFCFINLMFLWAGWIMRSNWAFHKELRLERQNRTQEDTIVKLTALIEKIQMENKRWKECRFYGGTPPEELRVPHVATPGNIQLPWSARYARERAVKILG